MPTKSLIALSALGLCCLALFAGLDPRSRGQAPAEGKPQTKAEVREPRVLPGLLKTGFVQLPNQWKLRPTGRQVEVGDLPTNIAVHPSGQYIAAITGGYKAHEIIILDAAKSKQKVLSQVVVDQTFTGLCFSKDGKKLYVSGGEMEVIHEYDFTRGLLSNAQSINLAGIAPKSVVGGLSMDANGRELFCCQTWGDNVIRIPVDNPANRTVIAMAGPKTKPEPKKDIKPLGELPSPSDNRKDPTTETKKESPPKSLANPCHPYLAVADKDNKKLYVSLWMASCVAVIDLETNEVTGHLPTASHPTELILSPDSTTLYVACANSTQVHVFDTTNGKPLQVINAAIHPNAPNGNTPCSLCLTPDGEMLFVANSDANNLAVFNVSDPQLAKPLGFIPTGWYPTSVRFNPVTKQLAIANGKGLSSKANRGGPGPYSRGSLKEYIGELLNGTIGFLEMPNPRELANYTKTAYLCSPLQKDSAVNADNVEPGNPIPVKLGGASPIKHVIYIIKENRTYDQVFGDLPQGNGEPELCLFPEAITANHHKLAKEFVLLDNFYADGEVSADGHEWSMGAYATDFVERAWPLSYRGSPKNRFGYPSEGAIDYMSRPSGGYIWDKAAEAGVSYFTFGEWVNNVGIVKPDGTFADCKASVPAIEGHFDPQFRAYDLEYPDVKRAERFIAKWKEFEAKGEAPRLTILKLPNDHTSGTRVGKPTPTAMVADNDLALGRAVEAVTNSIFWKDTAIFVLEDDTQNGPDHVDAHRCPVLVISPYTKRQYVDSTLYSTTSMLHTMELILGLKPMSQFDAAARPLYASFTAKPDFTPYKSVEPKTDLKAKNVAGAFGAVWSELANLEKEDQADDLKFNEVIWKSVKGAQSAIPAPVRAAFFYSTKKEDDDDDDEDDK
ncbi:beta-propeller fold lactonase family protein [Telmatocola sphagniphila]|uniref:Beta-propeller fold lactonase family protein n=1 Tax=Telmatocola sphagniphila TaxID=1123043 RepID=A0A8E6B626_9BACT|nr:alkaline phosphatase family protein [Telmatocola sphagniphila]QVL31959.1 beta-propeller fold lactonase family protein [Telmatocola sphagniphila]